MSTTATAPSAPAKAPAAAANDKSNAVKDALASISTDFKKISKEGKPERLKVRNVHVFKKLQTRTDTDSGSTVDEGRAEQFATAMTKGDKFPAIKVMRVKDAPGFKDEEVDVCWDGMHTLRGKEIAKLPEVDALVWEGTFAQAQFLASTRANREHEKAGRALSSKDKIHAVKILAQAYKDAEIPKKDWPSNREAAEMVGCSRQLVNEMDPFDRGAGDKREATAAKKRGERAEAKAADPSKGVKSPPHFEIVQKSTGQKIASYDATSEEEAIKTHLGHHKDADPKTLIARKAAEPPKEAKAGSEKTIGFDFAGMDSHLGYLARGLDGMGDIFHLKDTHEYKIALASLNSFAAYFNDARKKHGKKPAETNGQK